MLPGLKRSIFAPGEAEWIRIYRSYCRSGFNVPATYFELRQSDIQRRNVFDYRGRRIRFGSTRPTTIHLVTPVYATNPDNPAIGVDVEVSSECDHSEQLSAACDSQCLNDFKSAHSRLLRRRYLRRFKLAATTAFGTHDSETDALSTTALNSVPCIYWFRQLRSGDRWRHIAVPEPSSFAALGLGAVYFGRRKLRNRKKKVAAEKTAA